MVCSQILKFGGFITKKRKKRIITGGCHGARTVLEPLAEAPSQKTSSKIQRTFEIADKKVVWGSTYLKN